MSLETLRESLPDYAKDLKLNLSTLLSEAILNDVQKAGTFIVCALASRNATLTKTIISEFASKLTDEQMHAVKGASAIMGMNNIYYRFLHLVENPDYKTIPAKLRMNIIAQHAADKMDFELWCTAASAIKGCGACVAAHEAKLRSHGVTPEVIQASVRIASVMHAIANVLDTEEALTV
jgi:alkyl hydroperoxide reductase subunit D